ncbi:unnamed protein product [Closterium sp. NIES-65]|nr:unnamed protein product [Closterium sp. NIES-65]
MRPVQWTCERGIGGHADAKAGGSVEGAGSQCAWPPPLPPLARIRTRLQQAEDSQAPSSASSDLEDSSSASSDLEDSSSAPAGSKEPHLVSPISRLFPECSNLHTSHRSAEESEVSSSAPAVSEDSRGPSSAPSDPDEREDLQPVSPISRLFLDPALSTVILMAMEFEGRSMGVTEITGLVRTLLSSQPRFTSRIEHRGWWREPMWVPTHVDWPSHVVQEPSLCSSCSSTDESQTSILHDRRSPEDPRYSVPHCSVESHVVRLQTLPLFDFSRPLWQVHLLPTCEHIPRSTAVFRIHHVIGDGTSLMCLLSSQSRPSKSETRGDSAIGDGISYGSKEADNSTVIGGAEGNNESASEGDEVESLTGSVVGSDLAESSASVPRGSTSSTAALPSVANSHVIEMPAATKHTGGAKEMRRVQRMRAECRQKKVSWEAHLTNLYARLALALLGRKKKLSWEAHLTNLYARLALALLGRKVGKLEGMDWVLEWSHDGARG